MSNRNIIKGYIFVIISAVIFGLMPLMAKFIYAEGVNPPTLVLLRNAASVPVLLILALCTGGSLKIKAAAIPGISVIAIMGCCVTPLLLFISYNHIPSGTATVFHFIYPAMVVIGEFIFLKSKINRWHIISVIVCVIGIALFYNPQNGVNITGGFYALLSGITYAIYIICLSGFRHKEISGFVFSFYVALICSVAMLCVCSITNNLKLPVSLLGWILTIIFAICINVGAVVLFQKGTFLIGGSRASILSTLEPITSIVTDLLIFHVAGTAFTFAGTFLVVAASVIIALSDMKNKQSA